MTPSIRGGFAAVFCLFLALPLRAEEKVEIRGFYKEDGTYVKQRAVDPIAVPAAKAEPADSDLPGRRRWIEKAFEGRVVKAKVSFPACRGGIVVHAEEPGRANVALFKNVDKYGVAIEKGAPALITGFKVKGRVLDVDLSGGGFGTPWDVTKRVASGLCTLGWTEVRGYQNIRYRRGSRLRLVSPAPFTAEDLTFDKISSALSIAIES